MQAARGTSLSQRRQPRPIRPDRTAPARGCRRLFAVVALAAYAVDLGTKVLAVDAAHRRADVELLGDLLVLHLTRNPGAAFSTGTGYTVVLQLRRDRRGAASCSGSAAGSATASGRSRSACCSPASPATSPTGSSASPARCAGTSSTS